jgi:GNAT superfamily N-acetyltransferase
MISLKLNNLNHWLRLRGFNREASFVVKISSETQGSDIEQEEGARQIGKYNIISNTFATDGGRIIIWERSPFAPNNAHSIYEFVVDEDKRGQGIGTKLIEAVLEEYKDIEISGQVSSLASLKILYNKGFKNADNLNADFEELRDMFNTNNESLNMRINL